MTRYDKYVHVENVRKNQLCKIAMCAVNKWIFPSLMQNYYYPMCVCVCSLIPSIHCAFNLSYPPLHFNIIILSTFNSSHANNIDTKRREIEWQKRIERSIFNGWRHVVIFMHIMCNHLNNSRSCFLKSLLNSCARN